MNGVFDLFIATGGASSSWWHHTGLACEAGNSVFLKCFNALGDTRFPGGLVATLGGTGDAGIVAGEAGTLEHGFAVARTRCRCRRRGCACGRNPFQILGGIDLTDRLIRSAIASGDISSAASTTPDKLAAVIPTASK